MTTFPPPRGLAAFLLVLLALAAAPAHAERRCGDPGRATRPSLVPSE